MKILYPDRKTVNKVKKFLRENQYTFKIKNTPNGFLVEIY